MKSLGLLIQYLHRLGVLRWNSKYKGATEVKFGLVINVGFYSISIIMLCTLIWFFAFTAQTFSEYVESFYYILHATLLITWYTVYLIQRDVFDELIVDLGKIVESRSKNDEAKAIYQETDGIVAKLIQKSHTILFLLCLFFFLVPSISLTYFRCIYSECSKDVYIPIFAGTFPFDCQTPFGYAGCTGEHALATFISVEIFVSTLGYIVGVTLFITAFVVDIENKIKKLNEELISINSKDVVIQKQIELKTKLHDIIKFYMEAKQYTIRFSNENRAIIFTYMIFTVISFCSLFLQLNASLANLNFISAAKVLAPMLITNFWLLLFCNFGTHLTDRFGDIHGAMYQLAWYNLPLNVQTDQLIFMALAQKDVFIKGYADTQCTRELFKVVMKTTFSYFMVLRQFY